YFDRGPLDAKRLITGGYWSAYWYNGYVYGAEMARGLDVFRLTPGPHLSEDELEAARLVQAQHFNVQHQDRITWPAHPAVGRAYVAQLERSGTLSTRQAGAIRAWLAQDTPAGAPKLVALLKQDAAKASGVDASRLAA